VDVGNPSKPRRVATCDLLEVIRCRSGGRSARLCDRYETVAGYSGRLHVVDVRDPTQPSASGLCGSIGRGMAGAALRAGALRFTSRQGTPRRGEVTRDRREGSGQSTSNWRLPTAPDAQPESLSIAGDRLCLAYGATVEMLDISNRPSHRTWVSSVSPGQWGVRGRYGAYTVDTDDGDGLVFMRLERSTSPTPRNHCSWENTGSA